MPQSKLDKRRSVAYLSGAPRVSTRPDAEMVGPRSHVLGMISGFENKGWDVIRFIVGDELPAGASSQGSAQRLARNWTSRASADVVRSVLSIVSGRRARKAIGTNVTFAYERYALLQALGRPLQRVGVPWVLETNALLSREAARDRQAVAFPRLAALQEKRAYQECDLLLCVSDALKDQIVTEMDIASGKILVVPNAVDLSLLDPDSCTPQRKFEGFTVGFVGSLVAWQRVDQLLEAVAECRSRGSEICVTVVGEGPERSAWEALASRLGLQEWVRFVGRVPPQEIPAYIAGFDIAYAGHATSTGNETYFSPLKLYEYMAMATPALGASSYDDSNKLVIDGETGFSFESDRRGSLQEALQKAFHAAPEAMLEAGRRARAVIEAGHTWDHRVEALESEMLRRQLIG